MCGICGLISEDGRAPADRMLLQRMNATLAHRGPDGAGAMTEGPAGLAMRRLAIIDPEHGDQPMADEHGRVHVVSNGEIYNHRELARELRGRGHALRTTCDTEVLPHLYEEHGPGFVTRLRGMFAIALWDAPRRRLVLARDRFGIKPLFYRRAGRGIAFGSELKALTCDPAFPPALDPDALEAYLAFNSIPAPLTVYRAARKLPAGHLLVWEDGAVRVERYARPAPAPATSLRRERPAALAAELRERLADSVRAHLVSDVPVGVLLSGGVDSSALTALAAREHGSGLATFSIGFEERSFDELGRARAVARRYRTDHHEEILRPDAAQLLPQLAEAFDEPMADSSALAAWLVCRLAARHVKVVLSGEGADELFGGYHTYAADLLAARVGPVAARLEPLARRLPASTRRVSLEYKAKRFTRGAALGPLERHHAWKEIFGAEERAALLREPGRLDPLEVLRERYAETAGAEELARLQDVDLGTPLVDDLLVKTDRASMWHGLEARVPFLDPVVHELAAALPRGLRVRGMAKKRLLRRAVAPLVPREVARGAKRGFSIPAAAWLRGPLEPFAREVLAPAEVSRQGVFDPAVVTAVLDRHVSGREDLSRQLWGLLTFAVWHERHVGGRARARDVA